jgi:hypothetical protein
MAELRKKRYFRKNNVRLAQKTAEQIPLYELGREIGIDFPRLDGWEKRFNLSRPRKP